MSETASPTAEYSLAVTRRLRILSARVERYRHAYNTRISETSARQYASNMERMLRTMQLPEQIAAASPGSYCAYRTAFVRGTINLMVKVYEKLQQDALELSAKRAHRLISKLEVLLKFLEAYPPHDRGGPSRWKRPVGGPVKKSKRRGLSALPSDWRQQVAASLCAGSDFSDAVLVMILTGLRPCELAKGVLVSQSSTGALEITICGGKVTQYAGQPERKLWIKVDNPVAWRLLDSIWAGERKGKHLVATGDPRQFCDKVRSLCAQLFKDCKYKVSPYSFRHTFAADQKSIKVSPRLLAKMMGHVSERSQRAYGVPHQGRAPFIKVDAVTATRDVRAAKISIAAGAWMAGNAQLANGSRHVQPR